MEVESFSFLTLFPRICIDRSSNVPAGTRHAQTCFTRAAKHHWTKTAAERNERRERKNEEGDIEEKKNVLPFSKARAVFMLFYALTVPSPHVLLSIYPQALPGKVNPLPPPSVSHTYIHTTTLHDIMIFIAPFALFVAPSALIHLIPFFQLYFLACILLITFPQIPPFRLLPLSLHWELVQIPWRASRPKHSCCLAVVLNRTWLN